MAKMNKCPHCKEEFAKIIKNPYGKFCPHCDIRLFVEDKKLPQNKNITKETLRSIVESFGYSVGFTFLYIFLNITGYYNYFEQHQFTILFAIICIITVWEMWYQKKTVTKVVYLYGVDSLADYKNDNCDYLYVKAGQTQTLAFNDEVSNLIIPSTPFKNRLNTSLNFRKFY